MKSRGFVMLVLAAFVGALAGHAALSLLGGGEVNVVDLLVRSLITAAAFAVVVGLMAKRQSSCALRSPSTNP